MKNKRKFLMVAILITMVFSMGGVGTYYWYNSMYYVTSEDAKVAGDLVKANSQITGKLLEINVLDWRIIFTINVPIGIVGTILAILLLKGKAKNPEAKLDFIGLVTAVVGLVSTLYVLGEGNSIAWNDLKTILLLMTGVFSLFLFVVHELTIENPLLNLKVLKIFPFSLSILISSALSMAMFGGVYIIPLYLQNLKGYSAMQTGLILFPSAIATGIMMPSTTAGMNKVPSHLIAQASALSSTIRQVASSLSVTILTIILQQRQDINYYRIAEQISSYSSSTMDFIKSMQGYFIQNGTSIEVAQGSTQMILLGAVQKQAFTFAIDETLLITVWVAIAIIPLAMMIKIKKEGLQKEKN